MSRTPFGRLAAAPLIGLLSLASPLVESSALAQSTTPDCEALRQRLAEHARLSDGVRSAMGMISPLELGGLTEIFGSLIMFSLDIHPPSVRCQAQPIAGSFFRSLRYNPPHVVRVHCVQYRVHVASACVASRNRLRVEARWW
jgi:hypothetical protein